MFYYLGPLVRCIYFYVSPTVSFIVEMKRDNEMKLLNLSKIKSSLYTTVDDNRETVLSMLLSNIIKDEQCKSDGVTGSKFTDDLRKILRQFSDLR